MVASAEAYWLSSAALASRENLAFSSASDRIEMSVSRFASWAFVFHTLLC
jgi:hypothetical protein